MDQKIDIDDNLTPFICLLSSGDTNILSYLFKTGTSCNIIDELNGLDNLEVNLEPFS